MIPLTKPESNRNDVEARTDKNIIIVKDLTVLMLFDILFIEAKIKINNILA